MSKQVHHGVFELGGAYPTGETIDAHWTVSDDGTVTLTDQDGVPLRSAFGEVLCEKVTNGQIIHPSVLASRLALRRHRAHSDGLEGFRRQLGPRSYERVPY